MTRSFFPRPFLFGGALAALLAISPAEAQMFGRGSADPFANADANGDGNITRAEFLAARSAKFAKLDRNGDGAISHGDFGRLLKRRPQAVDRLDDLIAEMDSNHDGKVTRAEFESAPAPIFDRADANQDGKVDPAELAAARARLQALKQRRKG